MKVKICGQTSVNDCRMSVRFGADFLGVVHDVEWSKRSLDLAQARPIFEEFGQRAFLLTFDMDPARLAEAAAGLSPCALQLTGRETPENAARVREATGLPVYKSIHLSAEGQGNDRPEDIAARMRDYAAAGIDGFVLDTAARGMFGGTGVKSDWGVAVRIIEEAPAPVLLAGGINPDNVAVAVAVPGVYGIDLASGVESVPGVKSEEKLAALFHRIASARQ